MANTDASFGFRYIKSMGNYVAQPNIYYIPSSDSTAVFINSPVKLAGSADSVNGIPTVALAADTDKPVGVVVGVEPIRDVANADINYYGAGHRPADKAMYVYVIDDPYAIFEIQADDAGSTLAAADIGLNCGFTAESGDTTTGLSTIELDTSDKAVDSTLPLKILRLGKKADNEPFSANQVVQVMFNKHQFKSEYDTGETAEQGGLGV